MGFIVLTVLVTVTSLATAQVPMGPAPMPAGSMGGGMGGGGPMPMGGNGYPQVQSSHCRYLINAPSPWGINASPFKLYTRSYAGEVRRGYPIEVSVLPLYDSFKMFNFTDFACWSEPAYGVSPGQSHSPPPNSVSHVGVWQVFPQYAGGASSMRCNTYSRGEDTVGTFEGRMFELLKAQFPGDTRTLNFSPSARHGAAFLWYPDENALNSGAIKFVCKLKCFSQWFHLESTPWKVYVPPPPPRPFSFSSFIDTVSHLAGQARSMERQLDQAGAAGV